MNHLLNGDAYQLERDWMAARQRLNLDFSRLAPQPIEPSYLNPSPGKLTFPNGETHQFTANDLIEQEIIGQGSYGGVVTRMEHKQSGNVMAVKRVRAHEINTAEREKMLRELKIIIDSQNCEDIVKFYGAIFQDGDCWICMEIMDCSLDKFYREVYKIGEKLPESAVGFIAASVVRALNYLKEVLNIIHRDVKPSNILMRKNGFVKLCDFGISGYLVDSIAKTQDVGCQVYMAPERLSERKYDVRSDIWSLGISMVEVCIGRFPYEDWNSVFDQLQAVVHGDPPLLSANESYSIELVNFVNRCLIKDMNSRPKFAELMEDPFFKHYNVQGEEMIEQRTNFGQYVARFLPIE